MRETPRYIITDILYILYQILLLSSLLTVVRKVSLMHMLVNPTETWHGGTPEDQWLWISCTLRAEDVI